MKIILLVVMLTLASKVLSLTCPNACGTPSDLRFCSHISWPTCRTSNTSSSSSFAAQDASARESFNAALSMLQNNTNDIVYNITSCSRHLKSYICAREFPICEIGRDTNVICPTECTDGGGSACPAFILNDVVCANSKAAEDPGQCFKLSYHGPVMGMWIAGFSISLVFSILNSIGINLQKYSLARNAHATIKRSSCNQPLWLVGFSLVCLGSILDFVAFGMAPQTLLAPLAALSLVWNMFIAPVFHKEKITRRNMVATCIIFLGVTITVVFAGHSTPNYTLEDLIALYFQPVFYAYVGCILFFITSLFITKRLIESGRQEFRAYQGGLCHIICYGGLAGTFGGQSVLLAKSTVELLKSALWKSSTEHLSSSGSSSSTSNIDDTPSPFSRIETWGIIAGMAFCLISQVSILNGGLKRFDALVMIPVYQSFWILTSVLGGIMYFEEYVSMTYTQTFMFPIGGAVTLFGIFYLLKGASASKRIVNKYQELTPASAWDEEGSSDDEESAQLRFDLGLEDDVDIKPKKAVKSSSVVEGSTGSSGSTSNSSSGSSSLESI